MLIIFAICVLTILFTFELRHRMTVEHLAHLDEETHRLNAEIKELREEVAKKQDAETKKGVKLPFFP